MTSTRIALAAAVLALASCRGPVIPEAPRKPDAVKALESGGPTALKPYLDAYPIGDQSVRVDPLAETKERSMHFVQIRRASGRHLHRAHTETIYVLTGSGTYYLGDRSYPIQPGSAFRIAPGTVHSAIPDDGQSIVAVSYFEPPLTWGEDLVAPDEKR